MKEDGRLSILHQSKRKEKVPLICYECNKIYKVRESRSKISHYCSKICKYLAWKDIKHWGYLNYAK